MLIHTMDIKEYTTSDRIFTENGMFHKKSLPVLSIVQALEGSYGIGMETASEEWTGTLGAFIAPSGRMQHITHYVNADTGIMRAHWIFLDVVINKVYRLDDLFDFPVLLPSQYREEIRDLIAGINGNDNLCDNLSDIYKLIKILLAIGTPKKHMDPPMSEIRSFINDHYAEKITPQKLAKQFSLSVPTLYRKFKKHQGLTPANYINSVRLAQAAIMLETTERSVGQICEAVGIEDIFYFSRLFKVKYGISPLSYRKLTKK